MAKALLVSRQDVVRFTNMNGGISTDDFIQFVSIAQDIHIQSMLGTRLLEKIQADIIAGTLVNPYTDLNSETVSKEEIDFLVEKQRQTYMHYKERFVDYICDNSSTFPEYNTNTGSDMSPNESTNFTGWIL